MASISSGPTTPPPPVDRATVTGLQFSVGNPKAGSPYVGGPRGYLDGPGYLDAGIDLSTGSQPDPVDGFPPNHPPSVSDPLGESDPPQAFAFGVSGAAWGQGHWVGSRVAHATKSAQRRRLSSRKPETKARSKGAVLIRNRALAIYYSDLLLNTFQAAADYDPARLSNTKPPALWLDDEQYMTDVNMIVIELRYLNSLLSTRSRGKKAKTLAERAGEHLGRFFKTYETRLAHGLADLTIGVIAGLLFQCGIVPSNMTGRTSSRE